MVITRISYDSDFLDFYVKNIISYKYFSGRDIFPWNTAQYNLQMVVKNLI